MGPHTTAPARAHGERGIALVVAFMAMLLLAALGLALVLTTATETLVAANYRDAVEGMYAADAGLERTMQDLLTVARWDDVLASDDGVTSRVMSGLGRGTMTPVLGSRTIELARATAAINCPHVTPVPTACTDGQMNHSTAERPWGANNPRWRIYAHGPVQSFLPAGTIDSPFYVVVWVADDNSETDANPSLDGSSLANPGSGVIQLRAEALGPGGAHRAIEVTLGRASSLESGGGYTGQRGQDEQSRGRRAAAVQAPGRALTRTTMALGAGGLR